MGFLPPLILNSNNKFGDLLSSVHFSWISYLKTLKSVFIKIYFSDVLNWYKGCSLKLFGKKKRANLKIYFIVKKNIFVSSTHNQIISAVLFKKVEESVMRNMKENWKYSRYDDVEHKRCMCRAIFI
jgi:hypothetical protein